MSRIPPTYSLAEARAAAAVDRLDLASAPTASAPSAPKANPLVAARVRTPVDFAPAASASLDIYRHPADRNVAATGVRVGTSLDVTG
jgi:hypothetical protein